MTWSVLGGRFRLRYSAFAGDGMYGAMRYFYDSKHLLPKAGPCPGMPPRADPVGGANA